MTNETPSPPLKVFLCHASSDKPRVRRLYKYLCDNGVDPWLDEEKLMPGHDWQVEIPRAVRAADAVVVCLSNNSINKEGYVQKEITFALNIADEKPEGRIYLIPARFEECEVPSRLSRWQWVDLFAPNGGKKLLAALALRDAALKNSPHPQQKKGYFADSFLDEEAEVIPSISIIEHENYYPSIGAKTSPLPDLPVGETGKMLGDFNRIAIPIVGALSGFGATLTLAALGTNTIANSVFLFIVLALIAVLTGGGGAFYLNEYYQKQNIPIWLRYLTAILVFYALGFLLDLVSCIVLPLLLMAVVGLLAAYIYRGKG